MVWLKEIEEKLPPTVFGAWAVIRDLIAALRDAWKERDRLRIWSAKIHDALDGKPVPSFSDESPVRIAELHARADRAEAEVERLKRTYEPDVHAEVPPELRKSLLSRASYVEKLQIVCEVVETLFPDDGGGVHAWWPASMDEKISTLRRALDATK